MKSFITITYEEEKYKKIIKEKLIKSWLKRIFKELDIKKSSSAIFFTKEETIKNINREYRKKDYPTDVLSFSQITGEKADFINSNFLGDIVICLPYAEKQAFEKKHSLLNETYYLLLHGVLHLLGYDHEKDESDQMINLQNDIFKKLLGEDFE